MAELSAVPFDKLPPTGDGYTVLYDNDQVCRSDKKLSELVGDKTSSFLTKEQGDSLYQEKGDYLVDDDITGKLDKSQYAVDSATFLTAHQDISNKLDTTSFSDVSGNFLTAHQDISNKLDKTEFSDVSGNFLTAHQDISNKLDTTAFSDVSSTFLTAHQNLDEYATLEWVSEQGYITGSDSWKKTSEQYGSKNTYSSNGNLSVYIGQQNLANTPDSYTLGRNNNTDRGVNIGYENKIDVNGTDSLPGNFNFGKGNVIDEYNGGVNLGQFNSAFGWGVNLGESNKGNNGGYNIGRANSANGGSINIGEYNSAALGSYNIGNNNSANNAGYSFGYNNSAIKDSFSIGKHNKTNTIGFAFGTYNTASYGAFSVGLINSAEYGSYVFGNNNSVNAGGLIFGKECYSTNGGLIFGTTAYAVGGSITIGNNSNTFAGSVAIGARNYANEGSFVLGNGNNTMRGATTIGDSNAATYTDIIGNRNYINTSILSNSALSSEEYTKPIDYQTIATIKLKNFVAGLDNRADYAKNSFILGNSNTILSNSADYLNIDNDGYVFIYGWQNVACRNYDMSIGFKSIASGGENIAIGVPFRTITGYYNEEGTLYPSTGITNTLANGYKNFALRGNVTGVSNTAINSNLTGEYIGDDLGHVTNNKLINSFVSATTVKEVNYDGDHYFVTGYMLNNIIENSDVLLTGQNINYNKLTNVSNDKVSAESFSYNNFYHTDRVNLAGRHINTNTFLHTNNLNIESDNICRNIILNCAETNSAKITASKIFSDNIIAKTDFSTTGNSISSINENIIFNSYINGSATQKYVGWDTYNDCNFTRNFLIGSYLGNYIYNTFSFCDNSNRNSEYKLENTTRTFNFGDNTINKSENSFVFGDKNKTSAIARTFVLGTQNNINKTKLTNDTQDYVNDVFVFGNENNVIADNNNVTYPILERNRIFGIKNLIKSSEHLNDNLIVGNCNSISYNTTKPSKSTIRANVNFPSTPYSSESAAFATYRNNIFGNGNRISQCITDSLIVGAGNYVFDTIVHTPSMTADYNSIYTLGVGNIAYDGSNQLNIGYNNETSGHFAESIGDGIVAKGQQLIIGKCNALVDCTNRYSIEYDSSTSSIKNVEQSGVLFAIGNGTYDYTTGTNNYGNKVYYDKNKNVIPSANVNNEEYITRSNALIVSANGVVSANDYYNATGDKLSDLTEIIALLRNKPTTGTHVIKCIDGTLTWVAET